jgi:hypothetical protein
MIHIAWHLCRGTCAGALVQVSGPAGPTAMEREPMKALQVFPFALVLFACGSSQDKPPTDVTPGDPLTAAQVGLPKFLDMPPGWETALGFASWDELARAYLGTAYHDFELLNPGQDTQTMRALDSWEFAVRVGTENRCMLGVVLFEGVWQAAWIGASSRATELQALEASHPESLVLPRGLLKCGASTFGDLLAALIINPALDSADNATFVLEHPFTDLLTYSPQYSDWASTEPVPAMSYAELTAMLRNFIAAGGG